jgi:hypothetical protein
MYCIPVLLLSYFPLDARDWIDLAVTTDVTGPYDRIKAHTLDCTQALIEVLERGSTYRGYRFPDRPPSLRYQIVAALEFQEALPIGSKLLSCKKPLPDYYAIMERIDIRHWVEVRGVKEVWLWAYHGNKMELCESNMAGPWGDISNSDCDLDDLPVVRNTYTLYHYNYQRGVSEATEDHLHQIEAVLRYVDHELFWQRFVGATGEGRCGWSHIPPNGERDYDWANPKYVWSDIEDWRPDGRGEQTWLNCRRWNRNSLDWFVYWMQNLPGAENALTHEGRALTNWWQFIGDFDRAMRLGTGLVA